MAEKEYIERNAVVNGIRNAIKNYSDDKSEVNKITASIFEIFAKEFESIPAADVAPVRHGHWIECNYGLTFECSECKYPTEYNLTDYCPKCGAKMD